MTIVAKSGLHLALFFSLGVLLWYSGWGQVIWFQGTRLLPEGVGFGYYGDFHAVSRTIQQSPCAESIEYSRHEDLTLEDFHFQVKTRSGLIVRIWFHETADVRQVCFEPRGFAILRPLSRIVCKVYTPSELSAALNGKGIAVKNLNDVLCNVDELAPIFQTNYHNVEAYRDENSDHYLYVEVVGQQPADNYEYSRIR